MRVASLLAVFTLIAILSASECEAQRRTRSPFETRASVPERYQPPADRPQSWKRHVTVGMVAGGAAGLVWGLTQTGDENVFGLSPVIETAIGVGVGFYAGSAVYLVRSMRPNHLSVR